MNQAKAALQTAINSIRAGLPDTLWEKKSNHVKKSQTRWKKAKLL